MDKKLGIVAGASAVVGALVMWGALSLTHVGSGVAVATPKPSQTRAVSTPTPTSTSSVFDISKSVAETLPDPYMPPDNPTLPAGSSDAASDPKFPAAKTNLELVLFKAAAASCNKLKAIGAKFYYSDGSYALVFADKSGNYRANFFAGDGSFKDSGHFDDAPPVVCDPVDVNSQVLQGNTNFAADFLIESLDGIEFLWHAHHGGSDLSNVDFIVQGGLITQVPDLSDSIAYVRYGLNTKEKASALRNYY